MQYPEDDPRHRRYKANDGKFVLDGKRVKFSDYGGSSKVGIDDRLDKIESDIKIVNNMVAHHQLALIQIEKRVTKLEEK